MSTNINVQVSTGNNMQHSANTITGPTLIAVNPKNGHGCMRRQMKKLYHDAIAANKDVACLHIIDIEAILAAEKINDDAIENYGFSLDEVATITITKYREISNPVIKFKVFMKLKEIITTDRHPFTGNYLGKHEITLPLLIDIIEFYTYGKITVKHNKNLRFRLTEDELRTLNTMHELSVKYHPENKIKYDALYAHIKTFGERRRYK